MLIHHNEVIVEIQDDVKSLAKVQQSIKDKVETMDRYMKTLPTKNDIQQHFKTMDDTLLKIQEVSTGLTTHMDTYIVSESTPHILSSIGLPSGYAASGYGAGGPSNIHPSRRQRVPRFSISDSSIQDTQEDAEYRYLFSRGGNSDDYGDNGQLDEVPEDAPPPGPTVPPPGTSAPPPAPPGPTHPERRRRRRKPAVTPIKLEDPKSFEGKPGDDFEACGVIVQTDIHDQPEKFDETSRTIN